MDRAGIYFGKNNMPKKLFNMINKKIDSSSKYNVLIGHAKSKDDGGKTKLLFEEKSEVFKNIRLLEIGGALGVHTGPGAISVAIQKTDD